MFDQSKNEPGRESTWVVDAVDLRLVLWPALAVVLACFYYVGVTWEQPHRTSIVATLVAGVALAAITGHLQMRQKRGHADYLSAAWSVGLIAWITGLAALDGGVGSEIAALLFVPVAFAALAYPVRPAAIVAGSSFVAFATLSIATGGYGDGKAAVVGAALLCTAALCIRRARRESLRQLELRAQHDSLLVSEARFRRGFDHSPIGMAIVGLERENMIGLAPHFEHVNDAFCLLVGHPREWLEGRYPAEITHPDDIDAKGLVERLIAKEIDHIHQEVRFIHADGRTLTMLGGVSSIGDPDGRIRSLHLQVVDVSSEREATEQAQRRARQQAAVAAIGQRALEGVAFEDLLEDAVTAIHDTLGIEQCGAVEYGPGVAIVRVARAYPVGTELADNGTTLVGYARETGGPVLVDDVSTETRFEPLSRNHRQEGVASTIAVPIPAPDGHFYGALVAAAPTVRFFEADDIAMFQALANVLAGSLARTAADGRLRYLSLHDDLTGLPNRTLLLDRLDHALERARRTEETVAVMFVDVDNFKTVNDAYGHAVGDRLLRALPPRLMWAFRVGDTLARFGGDEFVVLSEG